MCRRRNACIGIRAHPAIRVVYITWNSILYTTTSVLYSVSPVVIVYNNYHMCTTVLLCRLQRAVAAVKIWWTPANVTFFFFHLYALYIPSAWCPYYMHTYIWKRHVDQGRQMRSLGEFCPFWQFQFHPPERIYLI